MPTLRVPPPAPGITRSFASGGDGPDEDLLIEALADLVRHKLGLPPIVRPPLQRRLGGSAPETEGASPPPSPRKKETTPAAAK